MEEEYLKYLVDDKGRMKRVVYSDGVIFILVYQGGVREENRISNKISENRCCSFLIH